MRFKKLFFFTFTFCLSPFTSAYAAGGSNAGAVLVKPPSARSMAISEAVTSFGSDMEGVTNSHYNPAASAYLRNPEMSFMGQRGIADDNYGTLFFGMPTEFGTFGGNLFYYGLGTIELINNQGVSRTVEAQRDVGAGFNFGQEFYEKFATGITLKVLNSKLLEGNSANAVALDLGGQTRLAQRRFTLGISALNVGSNLQYLDTAEPLPLTIRAGAAYKFVFESAGKLLVSADLIQEREAKSKALIGLDYAWNVIGFRIGYKAGQELGALSTGFGFALGRWRLDYALTDAGSVGKIHSFSMNFKFGRIKAEEDDEDQEAYDDRVRDVRKLDRKRNYR